MKFLCDVHISLKISKLLEKRGEMSVHVNSILDNWHTKDEKIIDYADKHNLIVVSKDQKIKISHLLKRRSKKLIKIGLGNVSNAELWKILDKSLKQIERIYEMEDSFMVEINKGSSKTWVVFHKKE